MAFGLKSDVIRLSAGQIRIWWGRKSLFQQFAMASSVVMAFSVGAVGAWVGERVAESALRATSGAAALYVTNFLEPYVQPLGKGMSLTAEDIAKLDEAAALLKARRHVVSIKIWRRDGVITYSTQKSLVGRRFSTVAILPALRGEISAAMADFDDDDSDFERSLSTPLYEIFLPLFAPQNEQIVAAAEIYEDAGALLRDQASAVRGAWLVVGSVGLCTLLALFAIVHRGSATIKRQRSAIKQRFREKMLLHRKNDILKSETEDALRTAALIDDLVHTRLGAELHDGPTQLISFVLLRLEGLEQELNDRSPRARVMLTEFRSALQDALEELRAIAADLLLHDLGDSGNIPEVLRKIIRTHEGRTACTVEFEAAGVTDKLPRDVVRCVVRVVQEALNNAYKHSGSARQTVTLSQYGRVLRLSVRDDGCGIAKPSKPQSGLGMLGMASRVRALGGSFSVISGPDLGTEILCQLATESSGTGAARASEAS